MFFLTTYKVQAQAGHSKFIIPPKLNLSQILIYLNKIQKF